MQTRWSSPGRTRLLRSASSPRRYPSVLKDRSPGLTRKKPGKKGSGKGQTGKGKDSNKKAKLTKDTFNRTEDKQADLFSF